MILSAKQRFVRVAISTPVNLNITISTIFRLMFSGLRKENPFALDKHIKLNTIPNVYKGYILKLLRDYQSRMHAILQSIFRPRLKVVMIISTGIQPMRG